MRYQRNIFLAGATALAFAAAVGFASAQEASHKAKTPQATTQSSQAGKMSKQSRATAKTAKTKGVKNAQRVNRGKKTAKTQIRTHRGYAMQKRHPARYAQHRMSRHPGYAQQPMSRHGRYAEQNRRLKGLQGNAAGNVRLSNAQRTQIRNTVLNARNAPRANNVNFMVARGAVVPRGAVRTAPVSRTLARINPAWRGYRYFVWTNDVVIVNPHTGMIVAVVYG